MNFTYESEVFYFKTWNLFVALCALPSLMLGLWLFAFPESPKFLLECGETDAALEVFKWIYSSNTGADPDTYPVIYPKSFESSRRRDRVLFPVFYLYFCLATLLSIKIRESFSRSIKSLIERHPCVYL